MTCSWLKHASVCIAITLLPQMASAQQAPLNVVATFSIIGDFAQEVGGDRIALTTLVGANGDAHVYEPRPADAVALARADVVLQNGLLFEGFLARLIEASGTSAEIVEVSEGADILDDPQGGHYHYYGDRTVFHAAPHDPHAWQSVSNAKVYVENIARAFCTVDAEGCPAYTENAQGYIDELAVLDDEIRAQVAVIPEEQRVVVVAHDAFRYFERDYGVTFLSPQGVSTESEASAADVASLIREIRKRNAGAVFAENIADSRLVEQIANEAGLALGGTLYSDALSGPDGPAPTYLEMVRHNLSTIIAALAAD